MKAKFKDRLSVKVVLLTLMMVSMTLISSIVGISSLSEFKDEYQQVKDENFELLLKMTELKSQTDDLIHISTEMLLSENLHELQWDMLEVSDKRLWIDKLFTQLTGYTNDHQELLILKLRLYSHLDEISNAIAKKFIFSEQFFKQYRLAEALKKESLQQGDLEFYIILDSAISHFNPIVNKQLELNKEADLEALNSYLNKTDKQRLKNIFLVDNSLSESYQNYAMQLRLIEALRLKNEDFTDLFVSFIGENVTYIQDRFMAKLTLLESELNVRKQRLYLVVFSCLLVSVFLLLIQLNFIRRIELVRKVIVAGESHRKMDFPIKGKDEISRMALSVKTYIERLVVKEQEVLAINKQLEHLASHDGLTSIFNRRYLETFLVQEHARYLRYKEVYCIAMIDLDFFKKINDNYGHDAGDKVLIEFTRRVLLIIRKTDLFARFGGEEFVLLMQSTIEKNALMLMERIRKAIEQEPYMYNEQEILFTVSIGLTQVQRSKGGDVFKQVSLADRALFEAKHAGRNRVCVYQAK